MDHLLQRLVELGTKAFALLVLVGACRSGSRSETETHFLAPCVGECGSGLACLCGVCTEPCTSDDACRDLAESATCVAMPGACSTSVVTVCDVECTTNDDCRALESSRACVSGRCRTIQRAPVDAGAGAFSSVWSRRTGEGAVNAVAFDGLSNLIIGGNLAGAFDETLGVALDPVDSGTVRSDGFLAKLEPGGTTVWTRRWSGASGSSVAAVAADNAGNILVSGGAQGALDVGLAPLSPPAGEEYVKVLVKYDASGTPLWSRPLAAERISLDGDGNAVLLATTSFIIVGDASIVKVNAQGDELWSKLVGSSSLRRGLAASSAGEIATFGAEGTPRRGTIAKLDPQGNELWSAEVLSTAGLEAGPVAIDGSGNVIVAGTFTGSLDLGAGASLSSPVGNDADSSIFVAKYDATGSHLWSLKAGDGGRGVKRPSALAVGPRDDLALAGSFAGSIDFGSGSLTTTAVGDQDVFVVLFDANGAAIATARYGDAALEQAAATLAIDKNETVAIGGWFNGTLDFDGQTLTWDQQRSYVIPNDRGRDGFVAVLAVTGQR